MFVWRGKSFFCFCWALVSQLYTFLNSARLKHVTSGVRLAAVPACLKLQLIWGRYGGKGENEKERSEVDWCMMLRCLTPLYFIVNRKMYHIGQFVVARPSWDFRCVIDLPDNQSQHQTVSETHWPTSAVHHTELHSECLQFISITGVYISVEYSMQTLKQSSRIYMAHFHLFTLFTSLQTCLFTYLINYLFYINIYFFIYSMYIVYLFSSFIYFIFLFP